MLNFERGGNLHIQVLETIFSPAQWLPFDLYELWPRFPRYAPNPFLLNHPSYFYYDIAWHSKYAVVFPHTYPYRMLRAITRNKMDEVVELLEKGFPVDEPVDKKYGYNALQIAALTNHFPLIEMLALRGADINKKDRFGNTPLMIAVTNHNHQAIHSLLRNGSEVAIKNNYGQTALDKAADNPSIREFLSKFNEKQRGFPRFTVKLRLKRLLRNPFWDQVKSLKIYTNKVTQNPVSRWHFDFTDYREVGELIGK